MGDLGGRIKAAEYRHGEKPKLCKGFSEAAGLLINSQQLVLKTIRLKKHLGKVELKRTDIPIHCRLVAISFKWHFLYYFASLILGKNND